MIEHFVNRFAAGSSNRLGSMPQAKLRRTSCGAPAKPERASPGVAAVPNPLVEFFYKRCLAGFPWFWPARPRGIPVMVAARRMARQHFGRDHHPVYRALAQGLATIAWPPAVLIHLWEILYFREPEEVPIRRAPGAFWAAMRHNVLPGEYYAYALWLPDRRRNIDNYLYAKEGPRVFKLINRPSQLNTLDDKLAFHEICKAFELPTPEILAAFAPTGKLVEFESDQPPKRDLFVKTRMGVGSDGTEHFRWHGIVFESERGGRLRPEELADYLATRAANENRTLLVQPALSNHPKLCISANADLATARLVTGISTDDSVSPIYGSFTYFTRTDRLIGRRVALIDVASGRLTWRPREFFGLRRSNHRFDSDAEHARMLPDWDAVLRYAEIAHRACSNVVFIGWDVAFTEQGPMLLEGNINWCADDYQRLSGEPLGHTSFANILAMWLQCAKPGPNTS